MMGIKPIKLKGIILFVLLTIGIGVVGTLLAGDISGSYRALIKPPLSPPGIVFPIVWNILYALLGVGAYILSTEEDRAVPGLLRLYWIQMILNAVWSVIFWRFEWYGLAALLIGVLLVLGIYMTLRTRQINRVSAILFVPYLLWLCFALYLNIGIAVLN